MSVAYDIQKMIARLKQADISLEHLCYELNEHEWADFTKYLQGLTRHQDTSYMVDCMHMGLHIRKRTTADIEAKP